MVLVSNWRSLFLSMTQKSIKGRRASGGRKGRPRKNRGSDFDSDYSEEEYVPRPSKRRSMSGTEEDEEEDKEEKKGRKVLKKRESCEDGKSCKK